MKTPMLNEEIKRLMEYKKRHFLTRKGEKLLTELQEIKRKLHGIK